MKTSIILIILLLCTCVPVVKGQELDKCSEILAHGIYETNSYDFFERAVTDFVSWFHSHSESTFEDAKEFAAGANIPLADIVIGLEGSYNSHTYKKFIDDIQSGFHSATDITTLIHSTSSRINDEIIKAWSECMNNRKEGLTVWIEKTENPLIFRLRVKYYTSVGSPNPSITNIQFSGCKISTKNGTFLNKQLEMRKDAIEIKNGLDYEQIFTRLDSNAVIFHIDATIGFVHPFDLPKVTSPKPSIQSLISKATEPKLNGSYSIVVYQLPVSCNKDRNNVYQLSTILQDNQIPQAKTYLARYETYYATVYIPGFTTKADAQSICNNNEFPNLMKYLAQQANPALPISGLMFKIVKTQDELLNTNDPQHQELPFEPCN